MKRYLLFTGVRYYPLGGAQDFQSDFDTVEEATAAGANFIARGINDNWNRSYDWDGSGTMTWWHVLDTQTKTIVTRFGNHGEICIHPNGCE